MDTVYLNPQLTNLNTDFPLINCLFGSAKLNINADLDKCKYSIYIIGFDSRSEFYLQMEALEKMSLFF